MIIIFRIGILVFFFSFCFNFSHPIILIIIDAVNFTNFKNKIFKKDNFKTFKINEILYLIYYNHIL